jgi:hypothetical protein
MLRLAGQRCHGGPESQKYGGATRQDSGAEGRDAEQHATADVQRCAERPQRWKRTKVDAARIAVEHSHPSGNEGRRHGRDMRQDKGFHEAEAHDEHHP